jgi:putative hydrolase of the HAD superfamily
MCRCPIFRPVRTAALVEIARSTPAEFDVPRERLLHVAQSLRHDRVPAKRYGLTSVWLNRRHDRPGWGATTEPDVEFSYAMEFPSMADFAAAARKSKPR